MRSCGPKEEKSGRQERKKLPAEEKLEPRLWKKRIKTVRRMILNKSEKRINNILPKQRRIIKYSQEKINRGSRKK